MADARELIEESRREERLSRRSIRMSRAALLEDGPAIRIRDVAALAGFSKAKLMADARAGELRVKWQRCGTKQWAFVERAEAERYLLAIECSTGNTARTA